MLFITKPNVFNELGHGVANYRSELTMIIRKTCAYDTFSATATSKTVKKPQPAEPLGSIIQISS